MTRERLAGGAGEIFNQLLNPPHPLEQKALRDSVEDFKKAVEARNRKTARGA